MVFLRRWRLAERHRNRDGLETSGPESRGTALGISQLSPRIPPGQKSLWQVFKFHSGKEWNLFTQANYSEDYASTLHARLLMETPNIILYGKATAKPPTEPYARLEFSPVPAPPGPSFRNPFLF